MEKVCTTTCASIPLALVCVCHRTVLPRVYIMQSGFTA